MNKQLGMVLLCAVAALLVGCKKKEDGTEANSQADKPKAPAAVVQENGMPASPQAVIPATEIKEAAKPALAPVAAMPTKLGDAAYPLTGLTWVKGEPVTISAGKVYVVEFWATWCPPCRDSIPHLTALQKKYQDRVTFVGVSQEAPGVVKPFVNGQADKMDYTVAIDGAGDVSKGYMTAFRQGGIPHAFIVDAAGKIVWHGHPMGPVGQVLDQVLAGTYSVSG